MGIRLSVMRVNTNKSPCSQVAWGKRGGSCCPINLIMLLLPEGPRRLPERATRTAQYVGIEYLCSAAPNSQLLFLLLFDLRFNCRSQCQMPLLTYYARDEMSINGRTLRLFLSIAFLLMRYWLVVWWNWTTAMQKLKKKRSLATLPIYHWYWNVHTISYNICLVS